MTAGLGDTQYSGVHDHGLLDRVRVLDFSIWRPGPYTTQLLVELGADVIKVEPPGGDPMRAFPGLFADLNAGKRSIELDLKRDRDRGEALDLAAAADVVVEGFRPGVAARLGIDAATVRGRSPRVVYCSISGFGQTGPLRDVPGHDLNYQALGGVLAPEGGGPVSAAVPLADLAAGVTAAMAICGALFRQARTGAGETIDCAMADIMATWTGASAPVATGLDPEVRGMPGYGLFRAADGGYVALGIISEDHFWRALCTGLGLRADADLAFTERVARGEQLQTAIAAAIAVRDRDELVEALGALGVPISPVLDRAGMLADPHLRARGLTASDGTLGHPVVYADHPARRADPRPPELDAHRGARFAPLYG